MSGTPQDNDGKKPDPLLQSIKQVVGMTNSALASFEESTAESSTMIVSRLQVLGKQARHIAARAMTTYEHRAQYGPQIVAGSVAVVGGAVALRRGRIPGVMAGGVSGAAAYGGVYGFGTLPALPKMEP